MTLEDENEVQHSVRVEGRIGRALQIFLEDPTVF